ncbi:hypothetical protein QJS10_CPA16g01132 [Acorus calamus]|uniref:Glucan endo-1,3-beta-D-glucosidase n=1 Tax=Acorus calamus TaxID=4465 RepID=A0AAV9D4M4_ACOCL|nr:hypothetical protein QJS10_CPA16g01132 [Acorus calamus]
MGVDMEENMTCKTHTVSIVLVLIVTLTLFTRIVVGAEGIGVNYGMKGDNLPPPPQVVALYKSKNISRLRLFDPNEDALRALHGSGIQVVLGTLNEDLPRLASNASYASDWVATHVTPHASSVSFRYVTAGNEVIPGDLAGYVLPSMRNLDAALQSAGIKVPVSTAVSTQVLGASYPPSTGVFSEAASPVMTPIAAFLASKKTPLLVNLYPYFAYANNPKEVSLDYSLLTAKDTVIRDGSLGYHNMFDAIVDAMYAALEKAGSGEVVVTVSETGWPSGGNGEMTTTERAATYNNNVIAHALSGAGTPKRPGRAVETYLFALFNENQKAPGTEQNFGLFHPDMSEVYHVNFSPQT